MSATSTVDNKDATLAADESWMGKEQTGHYQYYPFMNVGHFRLYDLVDDDFKKVLASYYRSGIDGVFGPGMQFALRAYQTRYSLEVTGRLDMETLAALGLLPGQRAPGVTAPRRGFRRPGIFTPRGEPIYTPR